MMISKFIVTVDMLVFICLLRLKESAHYNEADYDCAMCVPLSTQAKNYFTNVKPGLEFCS